MLTHYVSKLFSLHVALRGFVWDGTAVYDLYVRFLACWLLIFYWWSSSQIQLLVRRRRLLCQPTTPQRHATSLEQQQQQHCDVIRIVETRIEQVLQST